MFLLVFYAYFKFMINLLCLDWISQLSLALVFSVEQTFSETWITTLAHLAAMPTGLMQTEAY